MQYPDDERNARAAEGLTEMAAWSKLQHNDSPLMVRLATALDSLYAEGSEQDIPPHRHLLADDIVFIHKGSAVVRLGERELVVHEGGTVFIPRNVRITLRSIRMAVISCAPAMITWSRRWTSWCDSAAERTRQARRAAPALAAW